MKAGQPAYAGRVLFVRGMVKAQLGGAAARTLGRNDPVCEGDAIEAGDDAMVQLNMADGGRLALRPGTRMVIDAFANPEAQDGSENFSVSLVVGGLRAITGLIGKVNKGRYKINTSSAVIGIRGTDHEVFFVPAATLAPARIAEAGTYNRVFSGATYLQSADGRLHLGPKQIGFAPLKGAPVQLKALPDFLGVLPTEIRSALQRQKQDDAEAKTSDKEKDPGETAEAAPDSETAAAPDDASALAQTELKDAVNELQDEAAVDELVVPVEVAIGNITIDLNTSADLTEPAPFGTAYVGASMIPVEEGAVTFTHGAVTNDDDVNLHVDANTYAPAVMADGQGNVVYQSRRANILDFGYAEIDGAVAIWGLYDGGTVTDPATGDEVPAGFHHFAFAPGGVTPPDVIAGMSGSVRFANIVGFTQPTGEDGRIGGSLHALEVNVDLGAKPGVTGYAVRIEDAQARNWTGGFNGFVPLGEFAAGRLPLNARCDGAGCGSGTGTGSAAGVLIGGSAKGLITTYGLGTTTGQGVAGAAVLSRP
jgi:hypothetical protein